MKKYTNGQEKLFWSIKNSTEVLDKLKSRGFRASSLSTYDFFTLYTTLPHNLVERKLINLIETTFQREGTLYLACSDKIAFFTSNEQKRFKWAYRGLTGGFLLLLNFSVAISVSPHVCFILVLIMVSKFLR